MKFLVLVLFVNFIACFEHSKQSDFIDQSRYFYWEDMTNSAKDSVLSLLSTNDNVLIYHQGNRQLSDNEETFSLLDSIQNWHNKPKELYFYVFNTICENSDGAVSELLGIHCVNVVLNNPNYVLNYFKENKSIERLYATLMGSEFYFKEGGTSMMKYNYTEFKNMIEARVNSDNESIKKELYSLIEMTMSDMN
jgi:hypothetical protein